MALRDAKGDGLGCWKLGECNGGFGLKFWVLWSKVVVEIVSGQEEGVSVCGRGNGLGGVWE